MTERINDKLQQKKLSSLKGSMVSGMFHSQQRKKKIQEVSQLIVHALFLKNDQDRKGKWLAVLEDLDDELLDQLATAIIREDLRFKRKERNVVELLNKIPPSSQMQENLKNEKNLLTAFRNKLKFSQTKKSSRIVFDTNQKIPSALQNFDFAHPIPEAFDTLFAYLTVVILGEMYYRQNEYRKDRGEFLQKLQNGLPQIALGKTEARTIEILKKARQLAAENPAAQEITTFWTVAVPALDALVFTELLTKIESDSFVSD